MNTPTWTSRIRAAGLRRLLLAGLATAMPIGGALAADITLGTFTRNGSATLSGSDLRLTDGYAGTSPSGDGQSGSAFGAFAFDGNPLQFDFSFRISPIGSAERGDGFTFVLQNVGPTALGPDGSDLGYAGIGNSLAVAFDTFGFTGEAEVPNVKLFRDGVTGDDNALGIASNGTGNPEWFADGDVWNARIFFDKDVDLNDVMHVRVGDMDNDLLSFGLETSLAAFLGMNENDPLYMGFTAATGAAGSFHDITLMSGEGVTPVPLPAAAWLLLSGLAGVGAFARRRVSQA